MTELPLDPSHPRHAELQAIMKRVLHVEHIETRDPEGVCLCACGQTFANPDKHMEHAVGQMMATLEAHFGK